MSNVGADDEALKRLASAIDSTDTDEGLERVQTELVAATFDAIRGVIAKENDRHSTPPSPLVGADDEHTEKRDG